MGRRASFKGKAKAKPDALPEKEGPGAWDLLKSRIKKLQDAGVWAGSDAAPFSTGTGLEPLTPGWTGAAVDTANSSTARACGVLGDLFFDSAGMAGSSLSLGDVHAAQEFWYRNKAEPPTLPSTMVFCQQETRRGQLVPVSHIAQLAAFIFEWSSALEAGEAEKAAAYQRRAMALPLVFVRASHESLEGYWELHRRGEEVIATATEEGNHLCCRLADRLHMLETLQSGLGKPSSPAALFQEFEAQVKANRLAFASADSKVRSADMLAKLLRLRLRATEAGVWEPLKGLQLHPEHGATWASKWTSAVSVLGIASDTEDFAWMIRMLSMGWQAPQDYPQFRHPVYALNKQDLIDTAKALVAMREVMARVVKEVTGPTSPASWVAQLSKYLDPANIGQQQFHNGGFWKQPKELSHLQCMYGVVANHDTAQSRFSDSRIQSIVKEAIDEHRAEHLTPLPAVEKVQDVDVTPPLDCDIAADAPAEAAPAPARVDPDKDAAANAKARLLRYVKFVICDVLDVESVQQGLAETVDLLLPPDSAEQKFRGWIWDSALMLETSEAFSKSHNLFTRAPPFAKPILTNVMRVFQQRAKKEQDALLLFDLGGVKAGQEIRKQLASLASMNKDLTSNSFLLLPHQSDLELRAGFGSAAADTSDRSKRRRKAVALGGIVGRETVHFAVCGSALEAREHRWLGTNTDSTCPWLAIPLPDPSSLRPLVTCKVKSQILLKLDKKKLVSDAARDAADLPVDFSDEELLPLHWHSKHITLWKELFHTFRLYSVVLWSPDPSAVLAALQEKMSCVLLVNSTLHMRVLMDYLVEELKRAGPQPGGSQAAAPSRPQPTAKATSAAEPKADEAAQLNAEPALADPDQLFHPSDDGSDDSRVESSSSGK